jgi:hypothetical protein
MDVSSLFEFEQVASVTEHHALRESIEKTGPIGFP